MAHATQAKLKALALLTAVDIAEMDGAARQKHLHLAQLTALQLVFVEMALAKAMNHQNHVQLTVEHQGGQGVQAIRMNLHA